MLWIYILFGSSMWCPTESTIKEEDHLYSIAPMVDALDKVNQTPICVELWSLKNY